MDDNTLMPLPDLVECLPEWERRRKSRAKLRQMIWNWANRGIVTADGTLFLDVDISLGRQVSTPRRLREFIARVDAARTAKFERRRAGVRPSPRRLPNATPATLRQRGLV